MFFRYLSISLAIILFTYLGFNASEKFERDSQFRVIIITAESLRADMVTYENCPKLLAAASKGYQFTNYRAASGWTGTNVVSLLSGLTPFESGVHTRGQSVNPELYLPLEQLIASGYSVTGLQPFMAMDIYQNLGLSVAETSPDPLLWLGKQKLEGKPFFLWYHYVHTHLPYTRKATETLPDLWTQPRFRKVMEQSAIHYNEARYTREDTEQIHNIHTPNIRDFDNWFEKFWSFYNSGGFFRDTILVVTSDHGDEHGERHMVGHASTTLQGHLHEEIVRLPMFIWLPDRLKQAKSIAPALDKMTSHIDVMVTLFNLLGKETAVQLTGNNLFSPENHHSWSAMTSSGGFGEPDPNAIRYFEYSHIKENWKSRWRIYREGDQEEFYLYDLSTDAAELNNVAGEFPDIVDHHKAILAPLITNRVFRPVIDDPVTAVSVKSPDRKAETPPAWLHPVRSGPVTFASIENRFFLEWSGSPKASYQLEYKAGYGPKALQGTLEVQGNRKNFGTISKLYWKTWIIPNGPYKLRVRQVGGTWSNWISLEATP